MGRRQDVKQVRFIRAENPKHNPETRSGRNNVKNCGKEDITGLARSKSIHRQKFKRIKKVKNKKGHSRQDKQLGM